MITIPFVGFPKIARFSREVIITEELDGTNAQVHITDDGQVIAGSRNRWITVENDNYGFARWVEHNRENLLQLGPGSHFGEWWGSGIQRRYGLDHKRFSLFNVDRWTAETRPACCHVVPLLWRGIDNLGMLPIHPCLAKLAELGSQAAPGFMKPEGIVIYHTAARTSFKKTIDKDSEPKGSGT